MPQQHKDLQFDAARSQRAMPEPAEAQDRRSPLRAMGFEEQVQMLSPQSRAGADAAEVQKLARAGTEGAGGSLPHLAAIQRSFGRHDVSGVGAHVGGEASEACRQMGAEAYASGDSVAFQGAPSLHTAAHEAAHVVQQKQGVQLSGGVGRVGDSYEKQADLVADNVVAGRSVEGLLGDAGPAQAQASAGGSPIQMFRDPKLKVEANEAKGEHAFVSHDVKPSIGEDSREGIRYKTTKSSSAEVLQSDDGTLAINSANQAQEFYAKAGLAEGWNQTLAGNKTTVRLAEQGSTIDTEDGKLVQVKPTIDGSLLENLAVQECFAVANIVLGKGEGQKDFEAVFQEEGQEEQRTALMNTAKKDKVASYLNDQETSTDNPEQGIDKQDTKYVGKEYGKALGKGKLSDRVKKLGVNENAKAEVGEAFVTYSARGDSAATKRGRTDYSKRKGRFGAGLIKKVSDRAFAKWGTKSAPLLRQKSWEMHYAGVVAKSPDGADRVTLEDYNRSDEVNDLKAELLLRLRNQYQQELAQLPEGSNVSEALTMLEQKLSKLDWSAARDLANKAVSASGKGSWFMKMYGTRRGQTFHDQMTETGDFVNPMTMRVRKQNDQK